MMHKQNVLCCCEYFNNKGERSHLMGFCCDCEALDESFDKLITCKPIQSDSCSRIMDTVADRLRLPWCDGYGARKLDPDVLLAALLLLTTLFLAAQGWVATLVVFGLLPFFLIGLFALIIACCYGSNLTLTTICHPKLMWGTILLPDNCNDVYGDIQKEVDPRLLGL
ncbi:palmitoyltransferase ZDHHC23-like, partial [Limulus polyphemus]|uniref:Palmitoyltransferase ZDHHC23-like n=1 Tax=Limulus polyphemus TaxID=6850 RepID=A0ABM1S821_LIMPO